MQPAFGILASRRQCDKHSWIRAVFELSQPTGRTPNCQHVLHLLGYGQSTLFCHRNGSVTTGDLTTVEVKHGFVREMARGTGVC